MAGDILYMYNIYYMHMLYVHIYPKLHYCLRILNLDVCVAFVVE